MEKSFAESRFGIREGDGLQTRTWRHNLCGGAFRCVLCGERTDRRDFVSTTLFDGYEEIGDLCDECVKAGPVKVGDRIRTHAADLRARAEALEELAGDLSKVDSARWSLLEEVDLASDAVAREFGLGDGNG